MILNRNSVHSNIIFGGVIVFFFPFLIRAIVGNLNFNLANTSTDDGLISHSLAFSNSGDFSGDFRAMNFRAQVYTSLMNMIPALSLRYLGINPIFFYLLFLFLQIVLLPLSTYRLARVIGSTRIIGVSVSLAVLIVRPHYWNLSWTGDLDWMPYATWLALPFFILYIAEKIAQNFGSSYFALLVGFLFHPSMGFLILLFDLLLLFSSKKDKKYSFRHIPKLQITYSYLICSSFIIINYIHTKMQSGSPVPDYYKSAVLGNTHFNAVFTSPSSATWRTTSTFWLFFTLLSICIAYIYKSRQQSEDYCNLIKAMYLFLAFCVALQIAAIKLQQIDIMRLLPARFSIFFTTFVFVFVFSKLLSSKKLKVPEVALLLFFLAFPGIITILLLMLYYLFKLFPKSARFQLFSILFGFAVLGLYLGTTLRIIQPMQFAKELLKNHSMSFGALDGAIFILRSYSPYGNLLTDSFQMTHLAALTLVTLGLVIIFRKASISHTSSTRKFVAFSIIFVLSVGLINGRTLETTKRFPASTNDLYSVQIWAKENTARNTLFMGRDWSPYLGWRNLSQRGIVSIYDCGSSPYFWSKSDARCNDLRMAATTWKGDESEIILKEARLTRASLLLRRTNQPELPFSIKYQNSSYIVYELPSD